MAVSTLRALLNLMTEAVDTIEGAYAAAKAPLPVLDDPYDPQTPSEALRADPVVASATTILIAAAAQITATVRNPVHTAVLTACYFHVGSAVRVASELNVVEILREADVLAQILRTLSTWHIFREVAPGTFANNKISSAMDKGKASKLLVENREERFTGAVHGTQGTAALIEFCGDEIFKASANLAETIRDMDGEPVSLRRAFGFEEASIFQWYNRPENKYRRDRFGMAMHSTVSAQSHELIFQGFDWSQLPEGSVIVDVGSGVGSTPLAVAQRYPCHKVVIEDLAETVEAAKIHWLEHYPEYIERGMVEFQAQNFFEAQPANRLGTADVYIIRHCLHNWRDNACITILKQLRAAAKPETQLVVMDSILPVVSGGEHDDPRIKDIPGALRPLAPPPLLPNGGVGAARLYSMDMTVLNMLNACERTVGGFVDLLGKGGWKVVRVHRLPGVETCHIVATVL
ncbi:Methyltransf-2 domain-containing protein [Mycena indigotica]|uniref:Methyltransf-2 domain-containing protein n=1 Tax=Mycena indigotica TaxID=2126181 RepID=A0A8H6SCC4_9AGAR|nr:Methyltransf-2 domain-containing protein [Mycena indigotica]KAF7296946.1 Methyltransf-2 domain-containing protein [Mycena indigotica]